MNMLCDRLRMAKERIAEAESRHGRPAGTVTLLAVSKTRPADDIRMALDCGQRAFGENYVQELAAKAIELEDLGVEWHFIGPLQSNKTRTVATIADWVHALDRIKIAERLSAQRPAHLSPLNVCIQINVSGEDTKSGTCPEKAPALAEAIASLPGLRLRGLMAIPAPGNDFDEQRRPFAALRTVFEDLRARGHALDTLSMGMSDDLEAAIAEGSTMVRIGTAIFGERVVRGEG